MTTREPNSIDITSIERELTALWKEGEENEGEAPVVRACSLNLVVLGGDDPEVVEILDLLSVSHPARTFLISSNGDSDTRPIETWVAAKCTIPLPGEKQVCSEQIHIRAGLDAAGRIPSIVTSLLVPDVPVVVWQRTSDTLSAELFDPLQRFCDFTVLDSSADGHLDRSIRLLHSGIPATFGDLAWERGEPWRNLMAQVFDPPAERGLLGSLTGVRIVSGGIPRSPESAFPSALLFAGWFCHALDLRADQGFREESGGTWSGALTLNDRPVRIEVTGEKSPGLQRSLIRSVTLDFQGVSLSLLLDDAESCFRSVRTGADGLRQEKTMPRRQLSDAEMLSRLLTILDPDAAYRLSLSTIAPRLTGSP